MDIVILILLLVLIGVYFSDRQRDTTERLSILEQTLREKTDKFERISAPLHLLDIFDDHSKVMAISVIKDRNEAKKYHIQALRRYERTERLELEQHEKSGGGDDFIPSDNLKRSILNFCTSSTIYKIQDNNLQALKQSFIDVLSGKITVDEARELMPDKIERLFGTGHDMYFDLRHSVQDDPRTLEYFEDFYTGCEEHYKDGKWKDRLKFHTEMEGTTD